MSSLMLCHLNDLVVAGLKTSKRFKKHMYNVYARAINEKFSTRINGEQVKNHLKTWQKRYV
jgi:acyl-CoA hydrolase